MLKYFFIIYYYCKFDKNNNIMIDEITFTGIKFEVEFEIIEGEKRTHDYPGSCDRIELEDIKHGEDSFFDLLYSDKKEIEEMIYHKLY